MTTSNVLNGGVFLATTGAVVMLSWSVLDDFLPVRRSLHAYEHSTSSLTPSFPHSYATLDWIMTPELDDQGVPYSVTVQNICSQDEGIDHKGTGSKSCAPEVWQTQEFCPRQHETLVSWRARVNADTTIPNEDLQKHLAYDENKKELGPYPCKSASDLICYAIPQIHDACRVERIGNFNVMPNDGSSWSLASGHSPDILYQGAAIILWLVSGFHIINNWLYRLTQEKERGGVLEIEHLFAKQKMYKRALGIIAALYVILVRSFFTSHDVVVGNDVYAHLLPNASYFYVLLSIIWITVFGSMDSVFSNIEQIRTARGVETAEMGGPSVVAPAGQTPKEPVADGAELAFDTSNFSTGKKLDAYMPRLAPKKGATAKDYGGKLFSFEESAVITHSKFQFDDELLKNSCVKFEVLQLFVLPLLLVAITVRYNSWEIDSKLQLLYLAGFGYALFDIARNRVHNTCKVFDQLIANVSFSSPDIRMSSEYKGRDVVNSGMRLIESLCVFLQLLVFAVVFNTWIDHIQDRRGAVSLSAENGRERHMDWSIWSFSVYAGGAFLLKGIQIFTSNASDGGYMKFIHSKNVLFGWFSIFVIFSLCNAIFVRDIGILEETRNQMTKEFSKHMNADSKKLLYSHYGKWSNSWVIVNSK